MGELNFRKRRAKYEHRFEGPKINGKRKQISKGVFNTKKEGLEAGTKALTEFNSTGIVFE